MQSTLGLLISADDGAVDLCVVYMMATYSKYILHKASKPATYIWVRLLIGCVQYTLKYGIYRRSCSIRATTLHYCKIAKLAKLSIRLLVQRFGCLQTLCLCREVLICNKKRS